MQLRLPSALIVTALVAGVTTVAAQQAPMFTSSTRLVTVAVTVLKNGAPVTNLTKDDFEVRSNNDIKPIVQFTRDPGPITAALLLDASGSMEVNAAMLPAETAARELLDDLNSGQDRAGVFSFDKALTVRHDFGPVAPTHRVAVSGLRAFGSTSLYDAVLSTSRATATDGAPRRAVVVFTDGLDNSSTHAAVDVKALVAAIDVPVYILAIVPDPALRKVAIPPGHPLEALATGTGGQLFAVSPGASMVLARNTIVNSLRQHYLLAFEPDVRPGWHSLSVRTRQNHPVRARAGYSVSPRS
jgi:VWFA-related protein